MTIALAEPDTRYRLDVIAPNVLDVVKHAGGWLFDERMAGWDVTVAVVEHGDFRPLRILGVDAVQLNSSLWDHRPGSQKLAVAAELFRCDQRVRHGVLGAFENGLAEVTVWGELRPDELLPGIGQVRHRLSSAASVFKAHALAATYDLPVGVIADAEIFHSGTIARRRASRRALIG
jgi:hypothetical protein